MKKSCSSESDNYYSLTIICFLITKTRTMTCGIVFVPPTGNSPDVFGQGVVPLRSTDNITAPNFMSQHFNTWIISSLSLMVVKDKTLLRWLRIDESREVMSKYYTSSHTAAHTGHSQMKQFILIYTVCFTAALLDTATFGRIQCSLGFISPLI